MRKQMLPWTQRPRSKTTLNGRQAARYPMLTALEHVFTLAAGFHGREAKAGSNLALAEVPCAGLNQGGKNAADATCSAPSRSASALIARGRCHSQSQQA